MFLDTLLQYYEIEQKVSEILNIVKSQLNLLLCLVNNLIDLKLIE